MATGLLAACSPAPKSDGSITTLQQGNHELTLCDFSKVTDTLTVPLSEWVEDLQIVRFENTDTALFKFAWAAITDQYIGIRQYGGAFKLFDHQGKFLCDVGAVGQGPGEYAGSLYSEIIDEKNWCVYLAPFYGSSKILKYDMKGVFMTDIDLGERLNKPKISLAPDGSLSVFHLCFQGMSEMLFARIAADGTVTKYPPMEGQTVNPRNSEGQFVGFNEEIWSYGNTEEFMLKPTWQDTLFAVCPDGSLQPRFALQHAPVGEDVFLIYDALPGKYVVTVWGKGTIVADLKKQQSHYVKPVNDFVGNLPAPMNFSNGWFFAMYEPMTLMEHIETRLGKADCTDKDKEVLNRLLESLDEDDNNVMFIGKLKK